MKTMTCKELGGACDQKLSAASWDEMMKTMTAHVMEKMHAEDPQKWGSEMKWDAAPSN